MLMTLGLYHKNFCHKVEEAVDNGVVETVVENIPEEPTVEQIPEAKVEEETETSSKTKKSNGKNYGSVKNPVDKITNVTHKSSTEKPSVETTAGDVPADIKVVDNKKEEEDTKKAVEEADKNGDNVKELDNGIIAIEKNEEKSEAEDKKDLEKVDIEDEKSKAEEIPSSTTEEKVEEIKKDTECIEDAKNDELDDMLNETTKTEEVENKTTPEEKTETTEVKTEEAANGKTEVTDLTITEEKEQPVVPQEPAKEETVKPAQKEEPKTEQKVEEPVKEVKPVSVTAVDGNVATVGDSIQFKVDGDDVQFEGLGGVDFNYGNGYLTINCTEATNIDFVAFNSVNKVPVSITVNGVVQQ